MTGNFAGARFLHDASRDLDPQLHVHAVLANVTWNADRKKWMALQPAEMLRASPCLRQVLFRELAGRLCQLGYETYGMNSKGFLVRGVEHLRERFSKRAHQVERLAAEFTERKGRRPTKREVEVMVKESRRDKLNEATTKQVRAMQRAELSREEQNSLDELVRSAQTHGPRVSQSQGETQAVLEAALRHLFERKSVAREGEVLAAALELYPAFDDWRELTTALQSHPEIIRTHGD